MIAHVGEVSFAEAYQRPVEENKQRHQATRQHLLSGSFLDADFFPCWYCSPYYDKVDWPKG